jgi:UDP-N-acetylglucosamine 2-epimerase (non-hydrolysing)
MENALNDFKPDKVLILGDTNSSLCAIVAERLGYPVYHMEAGNRCYDLRVPEEKNRRIIDSVSSFNLPYTALSRENLIREGFPSEKIIVTGNPIREVLEYYKYYINASRILNRLGIHEKEYILVTSHRAENVDVPERLKNIFMALKTISGHYPVIFSCHPRTRKKLAEFNIDIGKNILLSNPFGFFDFVNLQQNSLLSITDSGTVQEESCLLGVKTLTIRDSTERPETVACGSNIITGLDIERIVDAYRYAVNLSTVWDPPTEYLKMNVSDTVINILLGK